MSEPMGLLSSFLTFLNFGREHHEWCSLQEKAAQPGRSSPVICVPKPCSTWKEVHQWHALSEIFLMIIVLNRKLHSSRHQSNMLQKFFEYIQILITIKIFS